MGVGDRTEPWEAFMETFMIVVSWPKGGVVC